MRLWSQPKWTSVQLSAPARPSTIAACFSAKEAAMWEMLIAAAQVLAVVFVIAGFGIATWYSFTRSDDTGED
jgi:hypothetical protein